MKSSLRHWAVGALVVASASQAMANVELTASMPLPTQPWYLNDVHDFVITFTNTGTDPSPAAASVYFAVPLETELKSPLPHGCIARPSTLTQYVDCPVPVVPAGASTTFTLPTTGIALYQPPGNGMDLRVITQLTYDPGTGSQQFPVAFVGGSFYIIPKPVVTPPVVTPPVVTPSVTAVPTMGPFGLGLLGAGLAALALRRRQRKADQS